MPSSAERELDVALQQLQQERSARLEAEAVAGLWDSVLSGLCHEIRSLLQASLSWTHLMRDGQLDGDTMARGFEIVSHNAIVQGHIVSDVLDASRVLSGRLQVDFQAVDVPAALAAVVESLTPLLRSKTLALEQDVDSGVGPIRADPRRLQQILRSLLLNAATFTPAEGRIHVALHATRDGIEAVVTDTGRGIAPDFLPHVFERLRRPQSYRASGRGGRGLGLAVAYHLTELHGGTLEADSAGEGLGATFRLRLPRGAD